MAATTFSDHDVTRIHDMVTAASVASRTTLVAIDGLGGAGKSTLAARLQAGLQESIIISVDDFYFSMARADGTSLDPEQDYERHFDWKRLRDHVLAPLCDGLRASYELANWVDNWTAQNLLAVRRLVEPVEVVLVDGVYSTRPELRPYFGVTVYVDTPRDLRLARMSERGYEDMSWMERWMAAEDYYEEHERPREHVDVVLQGG